MSRASTMLLYGSTGSTKTTQLGFAARYHYEHTGKRTRLLSADSTWDPIADLIRTPDNPGGIIDAFHLQRLTAPLPALVKLAQGWWPKVESRSGKEVLVMAPPTDSTWKEVGLYALEGLSTISDLTLQDHIRNRRVIGQEVVGKFDQAIEVEGGKSETLQFAKSAMSHFGHVQDFVLLDLVPRFGALPVDRVIWTSHEARGVDELTGKPTALGPATIGKAAVNRTAQKFADAIRLSADFTGGRIERRAYFVEHVEPGSVPAMTWPSKTSLPASAFIELIKRYPNGYVPLVLSDPKGNITALLEAKDQAMKNATKAA